MVLEEGVIDSYLLNVAQQCSSIEELLDAFFGFLRRRTDFFQLLEDTRGFPPGVAEQRVLYAFHRQWSIVHDQGANKLTPQISKSGQPPVQPTGHMSKPTGTATLQPRTKMTPSDITTPQPVDTRPTNETHTHTETRTDGHSNAHTNAHTNAQSDGQSDGHVCDEGRVETQEDMETGEGDIRVKREESEDAWTLEITGLREPVMVNEIEWTVGPSWLSLCVQRRDASLPGQTAAALPRTPHLEQAKRRATEAWAKTDQKNTPEPLPCHSTDARKPRSQPIECVWCVCVCIVCMCVCMMCVSVYRVCMHMICVCACIQVRHLPQCALCCLKGPCSRR